MSFVSASRCISKAVQGPMVRWSKVASVPLSSLARPQASFEQPKPFKVSAPSPVEVNSSRRFLSSALQHHKSIGKTISKEETQALFDRWNKALGVYSVNFEITVRFSVRKN
jgi:hypothetical protein